MNEMTSVESGKILLNVLKTKCEKLKEKKHKRAFDRFIDQINRLLKEVENMEPYVFNEKVEDVFWFLGSFVSLCNLEEEDYDC